jgi:glycosyltransferase involved in cell wall biosynthesis
VIQLKVLFTHELFPPYIAGGGEIYSEILIKELVKRGIDVNVVAGAWCNDKFEIWENIPIYRVNLSPTRYSFNIKAYFALKRIVKKVKPDIIHANTYHAAIPAYLVSRFYKIPIVLSVLSLFLEDWFKYFNSFYSSFYYLFEKLIFSFPYDKIIALDYAGYYNLDRIGLKKRTIMIPHPIETGIFVPKRENHNKIVIGTVGRLYGPTKRTDIFIKLVEEIRKKYDVKFLAVGKCDEDLKRILRDKGVDVVGEVPHEKIVDYLNKIDIFIGQGIAAKEAMACECITLLNESTPLLLNYHKPEIDADVMLTGDNIKIIKSILENPEHFKRITKKASKFVNDNYSIDKVIPKYIKLYEDVILKKEK